MRKGYVLIETIIMLSVFAVFLLFYLNLKKDFIIREQKLVKEKELLVSAREKLLMAMTEPIEDLRSNTDYRIENVTTSEVKVYLNDYNLFRTVFVLRRN